MPQTLDLEQAVLMTTDELNTRAQAAQARFETRRDRCLDERRDLTPRESELTAADRDELVTIRDAIEVRSARRDQGEQLEARSRRIADELGNLTDTRSAAFVPTLLVSDRNLREHAEALAGGRPYGAIETRARVTAGGDLGSAGAWDPGAPNAPTHLIAFAGIPVSELVGKTATVPVYGAPTAAAGADEGADHAEYDDLSPATLTALRYGRWTEVSSVANQLDDLRGINAMHAIGIARDLDLLAITAIQTAAGSAAVLVALEAQVRELILTVAANSYSDPSSLVVAGRPAALAALTGTAPTNGNDVGSVSVRFNGARIYPTNSAAANRLVVFAPSSFRAFQSPLQSASLIDPASGANKFGSWLHSTSVAAQIPGSALAVSTVAP